jgi:hypothetical protein
MAATFWSAAIERSGFAAFERVRELVRRTSVRPAYESGRGMSPTTALQIAGARIGKPHAKAARFWSAVREIPLLH